MKAQTHGLSRDRVVAALAAAGIALHLATRRPEPLAVVLALGGLPLAFQIARKAWARDFGADLLAAVSMATAAAMGELLVGAILVLMLSGGSALEQFAARRASSVLDALARRMPQTAHRREDGGLDEVPVAEVEVGDALVVLPHELCPVDGVVSEGRGSMDESYLTGEPYRIEKAPGSSVLSGAINGPTALTIVARKRAEDSRYASIMRVMEDTEATRPRLRRLADQLAVWYIPLSLGAAGAAWLYSGDPQRFLAVLVVATPCPLLIAIPVAVIGAISLAAGRGIVVKDPAALERVTGCRTVILDKTGTLTFGKPALTGVLALSGHDADDALRLAASLEQYSRHPLAQAVTEAAGLKGLALLPVQELSEEQGAGLSGLVAGRRVRVGGRRLVRDELPAPQPGLECVVVVDGRPAALFSFRDAPRPDSRPFLRHLPHSHGVNKVMILSGDREPEVRYLADSVGVTHIEAEASPERKVAVVREETLKAPTLFVGDGINDAPALAAATVGVAMGQNSDVTSAAAGAVILTPSIGKLDELIHIGRRMRRIALQSGVGGMAASLVGMALAAAGRLTPVEGVILQEAIDLAAILNAVRVAFLPGRLRDF